MRSDTRRGASALAAALTLASCQGEQKAASQAKASGEILPGSASDAMLPVDSLRSQSPPAPKPDASGKTSAASKPGVKASVAAEETALDDQPAQEPEGEPSPVE